MKSLTLILTLYFVFGTVLFSAPNAATYGTFFIGNSHTDTVHSVIDAYAAAGNKSYDFARQTIPGASLLWNYDNPGGFGDYSTALVPAKSWESLNLQIYGGIAGETFAAKEFYRLALAGNPANIVFLYNVFPNKDAWSNPPYERTLAAAEEVADALAVEFPDAPTPRIVPVGDLLINLGAKAANGQLPGLTSHYEFFSSAPGDSHLGPIGQYVAVLAHLACYFRDDIRSYPDTITRNGTTLVSLAPATGTALREAIWDYLTGYPRTGINSSLSIRANSPARAIVGVPYSHTFRSDNGIGTVTWSLTSGSFPNGLTFSTSSGLLSGTPTTAGAFSFTLTVTDSASPVNSSSRSFDLTVEADTAPVIDLSQLPDAQQGEPYNVAFNVYGGNTPFSWSFLTGSLPLGLQINQNGDLLGTPGETGTFPFQVQVSEQIPDYSDFADATLSLKVNPAGPRTRFVPLTRDTIAINGGAFESVWTDFTPIAKPISGSPAHTADYSVLWDNFDLYIAVRVNDDTPHSAGLPTEAADRVEIFLDAFHNREVVYNEDDRHFSLTRNGILSEPSSRTAGVRSGVVSDSLGYTAVIAIPWTNLDIADYAGRTIGFDVAVHDQTTGSAPTTTLAWWGDINNSTTTVNFGNLLLSNNTVGNTYVMPSAMSTFTATPLGDDRLRLDWTHPLPGTITDYVFEYAIGTGGFSPLTILSGAVNTFTHSGLLPATSYRYRLQPRNSVADGPMSFVVGAQTSPRLPSHESSGRITIEAESYESLFPKSDITPFSHANSIAGSSGTGYMETADNGSQNTTDTAGWNAATELVYRFVIPTSGTFSLALRRIAPTNGDDSIFVGLNGVQIGGSQITNTASTWTWSSTLNLGTLPAGQHTLHLRKREDGMKIDRIALTRSGTSAPTGTAVGPTESSRAPAPGSSAPATSSTPALGSGAPPLTAIPLTWANAPSGTLVWFIERAPLNGTFSRVASLPPSFTSFTDSTLNPGTSYDYRIIAANISGETVSSVLSAYTAENPALDLQSTPTGIVLSFDSQTAFRYELMTSPNLTDWEAIDTTENSTENQVLELDYDSVLGSAFYKLKISRP